MIARIRSVKPQFFQHYGLFQLEKLTGMPMRVAYEAVWSLCDREARFEWKPQSLKLNGLPYDDVDPARVLEAFRVCGYIGKYLSADRTRAYGFCLRFPNHQQINGRETPSILPAPPQAAIAAASNAHALADLDLEGVLGRAGLIFGQTPDQTAKSPESKQADFSAGAGTNSALSSERVDASEDLLPRVEHVSHGEGKGIEGKGWEGNGMRDNNGKLEAVEMAGAVEIRRTAVALPPIRGARTKDAVLARLSEVSDEIASGVRRSLAKDQMRRLAAELVFSYWVARFDHPRAKLDDARENRIISRLKENDDDVSELLYALDGAYHDDHIMGRKSGVVYDGIETILRDRAQVERFSNTQQGFKEQKPHRAYVKYLAALSGEDVEHPAATAPDDAHDVTEHTEVPSDER